MQNYRFLTQTHLFDVTTFITNLNLANSNISIQPYLTERKVTLVLIHRQTDMRLRHYYDCVQNKKLS